MKTVYVFPSGFIKEAESMFGHLRFYGFLPRWGPAPSEEPGGLSIELADEHVGALKLLAKAYPARFGNESEIERRAAGDLSLGSTWNIFRPARPEG